MARRHLPAAEGPPLDVARIIQALDRHRVEYLLVGGVSAQAYGAKRVTRDFDLVAADVEANLDRLAAAMGELNARLHVEGLSDAESRTLPVRLDATTLSRMEISTWRTDAGDLDVLRDIPAASGARRRYHDLLPRAEEVTVCQIQVRVASLEDVISSKEWADRPKDHEALPELYQLRDALATPASPHGGPTGPVHKQHERHEQLYKSPGPRRSDGLGPPTA